VTRRPKGKPAPDPEKLWARKMRGRRFESYALEPAPRLMRLPEPTQPGGGTSSLVREVTERTLPMDVVETRRTTNQGRK
jgi:hypothetical protein